MGVGVFSRDDEIVEKVDLVGVGMAEIARLGEVGNSAVVLVRLGGIMLSSRVGVK